MGAFRVSVMAPHPDPAARWSRCRRPASGRRWAQGDHEMDQCHEDADDLGRRGDPLAWRLQAVGSSDSGAPDQAPAPAMATMPARPAVLNRTGGRQEPSGRRSNGGSRAISIRTPRARPTSPSLDLENRHSAGCIFLRGRLDRPREFPGPSRQNHKPSRDVGQPHLQRWIQRTAGSVGSVKPDQHRGRRVVTMNKRTNIGGTARPLSWWCQPAGVCRSVRRRRAGSPDRGRATAAALKSVTDGGTQNSSARLRERCDLGGRGRPKGFDGRRQARRELSTRRDRG